MQGSMHDISLDRHVREAFRWFGTCSQRGKVMVNVRSCLPIQTMSGHLGIHLPMVDSRSIGTNKKPRSAR
jgi:hypothetical protein